MVLVFDDGCYGDMGMLVYGCFFGMEKVLIKRNFECRFGVFVLLV